MPEDERKTLWNKKRIAILASEEYRDADEGQLKVLDLALNGMIQAEIIESFIKKEQ